MLTVGLSVLFIGSGENGNVATSVTQTGDAAETERGGPDEERATTLFDIRRIFGGLCLLYGIVLVVLGFGASDADLRRASGINVDLSLAIFLLIVACACGAWALLRPLGRELREAEEDAEAPAAARRDEDDEPRFTRSEDEPRFTREEEAAQAAERR